MKLQGPPFRNILIVHMHQAGGRALKHQIAASLQDAVFLNPNRPAEEPWDRHTLVNLPDMPVKAAIDLWTSIQGRFIKAPEPPTVFTVIRDPLNLLPSRYLSKHIGTYQDRVGHKANDLWINHATQGPNPIRFDQFFVNHRAAGPTMETNGIPWDAPRHCYLPPDNPSPFDGVQYEGRAEQMDCLHRYQGFERKLAKWLRLNSAFVADRMFGSMRPGYREILANPWKAGE
jgi:hypothetical protein